MHELNAVAATLEGDSQAVDVDEIDGRVTTDGEKVLPPELHGAAESLRVNGGAPARP